MINICYTFKAWHNYTKKCINEEKIERLKGNKYYQEFSDDDIKCIKMRKVRYKYKREAMYYKKK